LQPETQAILPAVIAHRGASGYLPEHTLEAKALAYGQGADFLEQDVVATRDGTLIVLHDIQLEPVTDVARRYPQRCRADGHYYAIDFDIDEIRQLRVTGRSTGDIATVSTHEAEHYRIPSLEQELQLIARLNRSTGRQVGIYPEIKHPQWHRAHGMDLTRMLIEQLAAAGYRRFSDPVFVQCFDQTEIRRIRDELGCALPLIQLVDESETYEQLLTQAGLMELARYAQGLGPAFAQLVSVDSGQGNAMPGELLRLVREAGLLLHPYTFKRHDLPDYAPNLESLLALFIGELQVDGVFCDFPDVAVAVRDSLDTEGRVGRSAPRVSDGSR
jgi:glycerophosphoryl diester phosphodiesterase